MLPTGRAFDTVRISAAIIHAAAQSGDSDTVAAYLGRVLDGPVINDAYDTSVWYYALVPLGSCTHHHAPDALRLTPDTTWLGVPAVHRTARPGAYWMHPPRHHEDFCVPEGVDEVISLGRQRAIRPRTPGPTGPELDSIAQACTELFEEQRDGQCSVDDATDSVMRARGHLMVLLPVIEDAVSRMPLDDRTRAHMERGIEEAHREMELDCSSSNLPRQYAHALRLARCCLDQVRLLRELDAAGIAQ
ncbi:hypothetical protein BG418_25360 [Streptomyces sp. CBMA152]|nr:hypothetical protein [Streptomyces sp. CBMA152]